MADGGALNAAALRSRLAGLEPARTLFWQNQPETGRAAVLVPVVAGPEPFVLLTRRSALLRHHAGQVSFPGGRADPEDPGPVATALREAREEIGLDPALVEVLGRLPTQPTTEKRFRIVPVVGLVAGTARWTPAAVEVAAIFGLPVSVLVDPDAPRRIPDGPRAGSWCWPHPEHDIWGATAAILLALSRALRAGGQAGTVPEAAR